MDMVIALEKTFGVKSCIAASTVHHNTNTLVEKIAVAKDGVKRKYNGVKREYIGHRPL